jgi:hypothetical protein
MAGNLLFWIGIGAAQKSSTSKGARPADGRHRLISIIVGILVALFIGAGLFYLLMMQPG